MLADDLKLSSDEDDKDEVGCLLRLLKVENTDILVSISLALLVLTVSFEHSPVNLFIHHKMHFTDSHLAAVAFVFALRSHCSSILTLTLPFFYLESSVSQSIQILKYSFVYLNILIFLL